MLCDICKQPATHRKVWKTVWGREITAHWCADHALEDADPLPPTPDPEPIPVGDAPQGG